MRQVFLRQVFLRQVFLRQVFLRQVLLTAIALLGFGYAAEAQTALEACPPSDDATARRECLFKLWWEQVGKDAAFQASPSAPTNGGGWVISETTSPVDYSQ